MANRTTFSPYRLFSSASNKQIVFYQFPQNTLYTTLQVYMCAIMQKYKYADVQVCKHTSVQVKSKS